jgi:hypothetical protein
MIVIVAVLPGLSIFLWARHSVSAEVKSATTLNIGGLRVPEATIDIGTVWAGGQNVERKFKLENGTGNAIKVESVSSDCGCTVARAPSDQIQAGQSATIPVVFWPPQVVNDQGGEFHRKISVVVSTFNGKITIPLGLAGFIEPDATLKVFPVNSEIESSDVAKWPSVTLHFKGSINLLADIPDKLSVVAGCNQRVFVKLPQAGQPESIGTKDVEVDIVQSADSLKTNWNSQITFAPDRTSDGLTIGIQGHSRQSIVATPQSIILNDDPAGQQAIVKLEAIAGIGTESIQTVLPLTCDFIPASSPRDSLRILRFRLKGILSADIAGTVHIRLGLLNGNSAEISIPFVGIHAKMEH